MVVAGKQAAYHAIAEFYQSGAASSSKAYGEEIARLQYAKELTQTAISRAGKDMDFSSQLNKIDQVFMINLLNFYTNHVCETFLLLYKYCMS